MQITNARHARTEGNPSVSLFSALRGGERGLRASLDRSVGRKGRPTSSELRAQKRAKQELYRAKIGY